ncbi:CU044_5270 family protein [Amycolatopsis oliviviridis]|uniref:CU044_5270 family protein n=1 Tax=Amycolatopsis oliviviridis TaxID=1471590 RepID=A0ABQ3L564_9PSEU|nr:CU044_5270 family protein [Amycolatopsis oliviviridis]GHH03274.1 hypothetical protein GCM10017790_05010 [Amycolatopsis oliviviridis]
MDELQLIAERTGSVPLAESAALGAARARLMTEIAAAETENVVPLRKRRHWGWIGAGAAGLAAAITAVVALAPVEKVGLEPPTAVADPVVVLRTAAAAALGAPDQSPRPDQFLYRKVQEAGGVTEAWYSVDGTRDGLIRMPDGSVWPLPGCRDGKAQVYRGDKPVAGLMEPCVPEVRDRRDLPTDADGMFAYLNAHHSGEEGDYNAMGKDIGELASGYHLSPATRAALYEAAARIPRLRALENARDAAGRPGVGITWPLKPGDGPDAKPLTIVFAADTFLFMGTESTAVTATAVVDKVDQRP